MPGDYGLAGAAAIVTGGTRGIGRAVVDLLTAEGARVLCTGASDATVAGRASSSLNAGNTMRLRTVVTRVED